MVKIDLLPSVPDSTKEEALNPSANLFGQALRGIAHKVLDPLVRYNIVKDQEMKDFVEKIQNKTGAIPHENRDDSKIGLTLKAVEDSTYQLNSEDLREMFSNLIASTLDNRKNSEVLPSFSTILKDLSPNDAKLLLKLPVVLPSVDIKLGTSQGFLTVKENILLFEDEVVFDDVAVTSLERLGLIFIDKENHLVSESNIEKYNDFINHPIYKEQEKYLTLGKDLEKVTGKREELFNNITIVKSSVGLTSFGYKFMSCVRRKN